MGKFFKWLGIWLGIVIAGTLVVFLGAQLIGLGLNSTDTGKVVGWVAAIAGGICGFFFIFQVCAEGDGAGPIIGELFVTGLGIASLIITATNKVLGLIMLGFIVLVMSADMFYAFSENDYDEKHDAYMSIDGGPFTHIASWITRVEFGWIGVLIHLAVYFFPPLLLAKTEMYSVILVVEIILLVLRQIRRFIVSAKL